MIYDFDLMISNAVFGLRCGFLNGVTSILYQLGDNAVIWIVAAIMLLLSHRGRKTGLSIGLSLVFVLICSEFLLKGFVARARPFDFLPWQAQGLFVYPGIIPRPKGYSFPSNHAAAAFAAALAVFVHKKTKAVPLFAAAAAIGFSEIYLGTNYFTDVFSGAALGLLCGAGGAFAIKLLFRLLEKGDFGFLRYFD